MELTEKERLIIFDAFCAGISAAIDGFLCMPREVGLNTKARIIMKYWGAAFDEIQERQGDLDLTSRMMEAEAAARYE